MGVRAGIRMQGGDVKDFQILYLVGAVCFLAGLYLGLWVDHKEEL